MKTVMGVVVFSVFAVACSAAPPPAPLLTPAPTGFDNKSNGVTDDPTHQADLAVFEEFETIADGLGPLFNAQSCRECHENPVSGGPSQVLELRVGHRAADGSFQNPEIPINDGAVIIKGRTLVNQRAICPNGAFPTTDIQERVPQSENIRTFRISLNLLGDGFVEAVPDSTLVDIAKKQCAREHGKICGLVLYVPVLESPGVTRVGRFGWKDQHASLLSFSADAYLNEMGITNALLPDEVTDLCNTVAEPNDKPGTDGLTDIDHFARFVRATKAPARDARQAATPAAKHGEALFAKVGCDICHVPALTTAAAGTVVNGGKFTIPDALGHQTFYPYSDFLLHDVGTGDGFVVAMPEHYGRRMEQAKWKDMSAASFHSGANRLRTAPLWGVRTHPMLMHDGASLTLRDAIVRHAGESSEVTRRFEALSQADQQAVIEFLNSL
jgi:CxxC motif-containing protein (DUF1111 family)